MLLLTAIRPQSQVEVATSSSRKALRMVALRRGTQRACWQDDYSFRSIDMQSFISASQRGFHWGQHYHVLYIQMATHMTGSFLVSFWDGLHDILATIMNIPPFIWKAAGEYKGWEAYGWWSVSANFESVSSQWCTHSREGAQTKVIHTFIRPRDYLRQKASS